MVPPSCNIKGTISLCASGDNGAGPASTPGTSVPSAGKSLPGPIQLRYVESLRLKAPSVLVSWRAVRDCEDRMHKYYRASIVQDALWFYSAGDMHSHWASMAFVGFHPCCAGASDSNIDVACTLSRPDRRQDKEVENE